MKLEMDEPKKVHVELDLDEGNLSKGIDNCSGMVKAVLSVRKHVT